MKVLQCIPSLAGGGYASQIGGGAERQCAYLCCELARLGVEVHVAALRCGHGAFADRLSAAAAVHTLGARPGGDLRREQRNPFIPFRLTRLIREIRPDVVQSWNRPMDLFAGLAAVWLKRPWVLSERNCGLMYAGIAERARRWVGRLATAIVSNSPGGQTYWKLHTRPGARQAIIPNMVPLDRIKRELANGDYPPSAKKPARILYVGRFDLQKNIEVMIDALCRVASGLACEVVLLGDGPLRENAERFVAQRGLGAKFHFKGYQDPPWLEMRRASALVLVSRWEGHPNVVCEAMAVGCPVIVSDIPAHRALFSDDNAWFVDPGSPEGIAETIRDAAERPDEALRRAAQAERLVAKWSPEPIARRYLQLYTELCRRSSPYA